MRSLEELIAERLQNVNTHKCEITDEDYQKLIPKIELLKRLSAIENSIFAIYDMSKREYLLKSKEQVRLFGLADDDKKENGEGAIYYQKIHPDDLPFVLETENMTYQFFSKLPTTEKKNYKLVYDFRVKNIEGNYIRYMHQVNILEQDKNGKSWLSLVITDLLSERPDNERPQRRMINLKTGKLHLFSDNELNSEILLSKREAEVLRLIACGYDSKSISDKLFISVNTVNNHRQNILRKTRTENTTQALLYAKRLGVI